MKKRTIKGDDLFHSTIHIDANDEQKNVVPCYKKQVFELVISCDDEAELRDCYERFKEKYKCRILIL